MNTWLKSVAAGAGTTLLIFLIAHTVLKKKLQATTRQLYKADYTLRLDSNGQAHARPAAAIIQSRLTNAGYSCQISMGSGQTLEITASRIDDTLLAGRMVAGRGRIEFREIYTLNQLTRIVEAEKVFARYLPASPRQTIQPPPEEDTVVPPGLQKLGPAPPVQKEEPPVSFFTLVRFAEVYSDETGRNQYPAHTGMVRTADTALVNKILHDPELLEYVPSDTRFYYGPAETIKNAGPFHYLYAIRTNNQPAELGNKSIAKAYPGFNPQGRPEISLQFKPAASRRWARLTEANISRPIAIIFDDIVLSAPNVLDRIEGGAISISGGDFTVEQVKAMAAQLSGEELPAGLTLARHTITAEKPTLSLRYLLLVLVIFAAMTGLAFVIFKLLKHK
ncbi:MAG: hypothetical protein ABW019_16445 [Chitinophagaceae bacterium]